MSNRKSMVIYYDMIDLLELMKPEDVKDLILAMLHYSRDGIMPDSIPSIDYVFRLLKGQIDRDNERYEETAKKRTEAGKKGRQLAKQTEANKSNATFAEQNEQMPANASKCQQMLANQADTDTVTDTVTDIYKSSISSDPQPDPPKRAHADTVPYQKIVDMFNNTCTKLPKVQSLNDGRRRAIAARYKEHGMDELEKAFALVEASAFLTGGSFACGFDWIMKQANFQKILEGSYDDKPGQRASPKKTRFHNFTERGTDYAALIGGGDL